MQLSTIENSFEFIRNGKSIKQIDGKGYPITRIETISNGIVDVNKMGYANIYQLENYSDYLLKDNDILMSHINSEKHLGKVAIFDLDDEVIHGMNLLCLRPNDKILGKYAFYYFNSLAFKKQIPNITKKSVNQASFTVTALKQLYIPLPPLPTQRKIVEVLDKAQSLIDKRKEQIELLDKLIQSTFYDMFGDPVKNDMGWEVKTINDICSKITDGEHVTPKRESQGIYLLSARNIYNHYLKLDDVDYISEEEYSRISKRIIPEEGNVLISCSGSVGRVCRVKDNVKFQMVRSVAILKLNNTCTPIFVEYAIDTPFIQNQINSSVNQSSQANLFQGKIKKLKIIAPPIELQTQFAQKVEKIEQQKALLNQSLKLMEDNFNSLMQRAFRGEIV